MANKLWIGCLVLFLVACGGDGGFERKDPPSTSKSATELKVVSQREIELDDRVLALSPDGQWLAIEKMEVICIYSTESLLEHVCTPWEGGGLDSHSFTWSPDSKKIAFTENYPVYFHESDIWLMEAESGKLTNLTDDGVDRARPGSEGMDRALIDLIPAWSPDGKTLLFARSTQSDGDWQGTALYQIPAKGGDPKQLLTADAEYPASVWHSLMYSRDGKQIFYTVFRREADDPDNGVWVAEADGKNPKHLLSTSDPDMGPPFLLEVSAKGDKALVVYYLGLGRYAAEFNLSFVALLNLETGRAEPLKRAKGEEFEFSGLYHATFSPDGSKLLYVYRDLELKWYLVVRDVADGTEKVLLTSEEPIGAHRDFGLGIDWADDDTIFLAGPVGRGGLLLSIGSD